MAGGLRACGPVGGSAGIRARQLRLYVAQVPVPATMIDDQELGESAGTPHATLLTS